MPDLIVSSAVDSMMQAADAAGIRSSIGLAAAPRLLWSEDFTGASYDTSVIKSFNGATLSFDAANDQLDVTFTNNAQGVYLDEAALGLVDNEWYVIEARWSGTQVSICFISAWSNANVPRSSHINQAYEAVHYHKQSSTGSGANHSPLISGQNTAASGSWSLDYVRVYAGVPASMFQNGTQAPIVIGEQIRYGGSQTPVDGIYIGHNIESQDGRQEVVIGHNARGVDFGVSEPNVAIGAGATLAGESAFGGNTVNGDRVAIGEGARAGCWRSTAVGGKAMALDTSATAVGAGAVSEVTHGVALGRGAYIPHESGLADVTVIESRDLYLSNGWGHRCDTVPSGLSISEETGTTPSSIPSTIHGKDAFDARATPSDTNIAGGELRLAGGRGTGSAVGGAVSFQTAPAGTSGASKNALVTAGQFDTLATGTDDTRFLLLDLSDGTLKRVSFGADDSGGTGFKVLRVAN